MSGTYTESILTDSISSLSSSRTIRTTTKGSSSLISKTYKQASNLFLTRRLPEALQVVEPIIAPPKPDDDEDHQEQIEHRDPAPIASASKSARVKVWNLYITLLNAIVELGPEDGKAQFGTAQWRALVAKARDGTVWEDVVRNGYHGREGRVDTDVISNLATLLLSHSPTQTLNQSRLETYLATSGECTFDISDRFETSSNVSAKFHPTPVRASGTNTPRDLNSRLKIIELYALHVLPRNEEWDYAQEFISMSDLLDEERRELFLQTLHSLKDQKQEDDYRDAQILQSRQEDLEREERAAEDRRLAETKLQDEDQLQESSNKQQHRRSDSEKDYGIEDITPVKKSKKQTNLSGRDAKEHQVKGPKFSQRPSNSRKPPLGMYKRSMLIMNAFQQLVLRAAKSMSESPAVLLRTLLFLIALLLALSRRDTRDWLTRFSGIGWNRLKRTVGMGVKVSYI
ncbi:hypothetical protein MMC10_011219 [Thelotrema lepadinum]|nr:hypothetical protein [Thelotrema lepadinum]